MQDKHILLAVLAQIILTFIAYMKLLVAKKGAEKRGEVDEARRALHPDAWPESVQKVNNNIRNQFEVPVLFYILVLMLYQLKAVDLLAHIGAWTFVASRYGHAFIHLGSNYVPMRRRFFMLTWVSTLFLIGLVAKAILF